MAVPLDRAEAQVRVTSLPQVRALLLLVLLLLLLLQQPEELLRLIHIAP